MTEESVHPRGGACRRGDEGGNRSEDASCLFAYDDGFARDLRARAVKGVAWNFLGRASEQAIRLVVQLVLARLLLPDDFGLVGMALVVVALARVFRDVGFHSAIVQRRELSDVELSSVFWINLLAGVVLTVAVGSTAPLASKFYGRRELVLVLVFLSSTMFFGSLSQVPAALLRRGLRFRSLAIPGIVASLAAGALGIGMAVTGWGVWSLVARAVADAVLRAGLLWTVVGWRPRFTFRYAAVRPLLLFSLPIFGFVLLNYVNTQFDYLIVGKALGGEALGYYTLAYTIMLLPMSQISSTVCSVAYPIFSSLQDDTEMVANHYLRMLTWIAMAAFPIMVGLASLAPVAVPWLLGEKWLPAVLPIQILAVLGAVQALQATSRTGFRSQGRTGLELKTFLCVTPAIVASFVIGVRWGVVGVCIAYSSVMVVVTAIVLGIVLGLLGRGLGSLLGAIWRPGFAAGAMAGALFAFGALRPRVGFLQTDALFLGCAVVLGVVVYAVLLALVSRDDLAAAWRLARQAVGITSSSEARPVA